MPSIAQTGPTLQWEQHFSFKNVCLSSVLALRSASGSSNANRFVSLASFQKVSALSITPPKTCKCIIVNMIITDTNNGQQLNWMHTEVFLLVSYGRTMARTVVGLSQRRPGFDPTLILVGFCDRQNSTMMGTSHEHIRLPLSIIPPVFHSHSHIIRRYTTCVTDVVK